MKKVFLVAVVAVVMVGCTKTIYQPVETIVEVEKVSVAHDTTIIKEREVLREKGDTIYVEKVRTEYRYLTNTIEVERVDSICVPVEVERIVEVERERRWWEKVLMWAGVAAIVVAVAWIVWKVK